jgi:hypothetical protein
LRQTRKKWHLPFGGVQVMLIGDMFQLPPVVQPDEWSILSQVYSSPYFFDSLVIRNHRPVYIELTKIYRQNEKRFIDLLNKVRNNKLEREDMELLNSHYKSNISQEDYRNNITLTTHNKKADAINEQTLKELPGKIFSFNSEVDGIFPERNYPADEELSLKKGTRVMFLKNNSEKNYYNGKTGVISFIDEKNIKVKCDEDENEIEVRPEVWNNVTYQTEKNSRNITEDVIGTFKQMPLRLAWAITIHKSQGLTFDKVIIDAAEAFSSGQVYVALSRCRGLEGLTLSSKISPDSLMCDNRVSTFSSAKPDEEQIENIFSGAQKNYFRQVLLDLFDFSGIYESRMEIGGYLQVHKSRLNADGLEWAAELLPKFDQLAEVSRKFRKQMSELMAENAEIESNSKLRERLKKAAEYFEAECEIILKALRNCGLRTESKEAAEELNPLLTALYEELYFKNGLISVCKKDFDFQELVRQRMEQKIPFPGINIYASAKNTKISGEIKNPALFRKLLLLRDDICNDEHLPIYMVANNKTLQELSEFLPVKEEQLLQISGFGKAKTGDYGERFLEVIRKYMDENGLQSNMDAKPVKKKKSKKKDAEENEVNTPEKSDTKEQTYNLFKEGLKPEEIAKKRGFALGTIEGHLASFVAKGEINIDDLIDRAKKEQILKALENFDESQGLGAIKKNLPDEISYSQIKYVLAHKKSMQS